jgi:hypothetical protein
MARTNAEHQRAWRQRRAAELEQLRSLRKDSDPPEDDPLVARVLDVTGDGTWHRLSAIVAKARGGLDVTEADVLPVLEAIRLRGAYGAWAERRQSSAGWQYRVRVGTGRTVNLDVLLAEVEPILVALEAEGRKNMATMSPGTVAHLAVQLRRTLRAVSRGPALT